MRKRSRNWTKASYVDLSMYGVIFRLRSIEVSQSKKGLIICFPERHQKVWDQTTWQKMGSPHGWMSLYSRSFSSFSKPIFLPIKFISLNLNTNSCLVSINCFKAFTLVFSSSILIFGRSALCRKWKYQVRLRTQVKKKSTVPEISIKLFLTWYDQLQQKNKFIPDCIWVFK